MKKNNLSPDAINHALAANRIERILQLTQGMAIHKMNDRELNALLRWLDGLPELPIRQYPWLLVVKSWALLNTGEYEDVEENLAEIESILSTEPMPEDQESRIQGHAAAIRSYLAELREDLKSAIRQADDALVLLTDKDTQLKSYVAIRWANSMVVRGDFDKAIPAYKEAGETSKIIGDGQLAITALSEMAVVQMVAGNLPQAIQNIRDICDYAETLAQRDGRRLPAMGILYRHLSLITRQQNKLPEAKFYAKEAVKICQQSGDKEALMFGLLALARVHFAYGDFQDLDQTAHQILQIADQISPKMLGYFQNWAYHFQLHQGKTQNVELWARELGLTAEDEISFERLLDYQNYARLLAAKGFHAQALKIVNALLKVVEDAGAGFYSIQYNMFQAIILEQLGKLDEALMAMKQALSLASAGGYIRAILEEGERTAGLLYQAAQQGIHPEYCSILLDELTKYTPTTSIHQEGSPDLVEPLSERETEVLTYIAQGLTNQEIAQELVLSVYTIKSHARNIFSKLGVKNRTEAVARARLLGLLPKGGGST